MLKGGVLVLPTCGGTWTREQVNTDPIATNSQMGLYTNHCNLLDLSAIAIPAGFAKDRLPFGITLFTRLRRRLIWWPRRAFSEADGADHRGCLWTPHARDGT